MSTALARVKIIRKHQAGLDSMTSVISAIEAGTGVGLAMDALGYSFGSKVKLVGLTSEPKPFSFGIVARKGRLSAATEEFWQCAKEVRSVK